MNEHEWLNGICSLEVRRADALGHPWTIQRTDGPWTVATNGHVLAARRGAFGFPDADSNTPNFENVMPLPATAPKRIRLDALRALALPCLASNLPACGTCNSTGNIECEECEGEGGAECECHCGDVHDTDCEACGGVGSTGCKDCPDGLKAARTVRPVWIGEGVFDLRLFATPLAHIDGDTALFRQVAPERGGFFDIGEWLLVVMSMRYDTKYDESPRIEFSAADECVPVSAPPETTER